MTDAPETRSRRTVLVVAGAVGLLVAGAAWAYVAFRGAGPPVPAAGRPAGQPARPVARLDAPDPPADDYVGSRVCAECHAEIAKVYANHPMARSLAAVSEATPIEDYAGETGFAPPGRRTYRVEKSDDGRVRHHEAMAARDGTPIYDQGIDVHYALGSGTRGRAYLIDRGGLLFLSPINWYSQKGKWDLAAGYKPEAHARFERRAIDACLECHVGRLAYDRDVPNRYGAPPFLEESIGCERCHGPGRSHVERYRSPAATADVHDAIVNPGKLEPALREAVCNQCHLQGAERVTRYGRTDHDFRPGQRLEDVWTVFVGGGEPAEGGATEAVSQVEQMRSSGCYVGTEGRLGCVSCHDPHSVPDPATERVFFDAKCANCHDDAHGCALPAPERQAAPAAGSCIACHMPRSPTSDVPHTSQSDHRIPRFAGRAEPAAPRGGTGGLTVFDDADERMPPAEAARARGLALARKAEGDSDAALAYEAERLLRQAAAAAPDDVETLETLGTLNRIQNRLPDAERFWARVLEIDPERESTLVRLATLYHDAGRLEEASDLLGRAIAVDPWLSELHGRRAHVLGQLGRLEEATKSAERALELNPTLEQIYGWLAEAYRTLGDAAAGERYRRLYERISER